MPDRSLFQKMAEGESQVKNAVNLDEAWSLVERFQTLVRHSSWPDEFVAGDYLVERLQKLGVPHTRHNAKLYLSIPGAARVVAGGEEFYAKTPSFSAITGSAGLTAPLAYLPEESPEGFSVTPELEAKVKGKIVLTEWPPAAEMVVRQLAAAGAVGAAFVHPGERIHEDTCTTVWGLPEVASMSRIPTVPVVNVAHKIGERLLEFASKGDSQATLHTSLDTGWKDTGLIVAEIPGTVWPDEFVLLHGHLDSWHAGIGDNATGNATMLEVARVFWENRASLRRGVRIAWWTGHSTGRYAGSTWFADKYALDLVENCVAQVNCDSTGCRWATDLTAPPSMVELSEFTAQAVLDVAGQKANPGRPHRAGDYSFLNLGLSGTMMLSSKIPDEVKKEKSLYGVGGCGGNNEWHTEADTIEVADKEILLRDTKLYAVMVWRLSNLAVHPADYASAAREIQAYAAQYQKDAGGAVDLSLVIREAGRLADECDAVYKALSGCGGDTCGACKESVKKVNALLRKAGRTLVELDYTFEGRFHQDPAQPLRPLPDLAWAKNLRDLDPSSDVYGFTLVSLNRGKNRVLYGLRDAAGCVARAKEIVCGSTVG